MKFKVGDTIIAKQNNGYCTMTIKNNFVGKVIDTFSRSNDEDDIRVKIIKGNRGIGNCYNAESKSFTLNSKAKKDKGIRYLAYGTGCNNKSDILLDEKELKNELKEVNKDNSWTGDIIGYKLTPIFEVKTTTTIRRVK